MRGRCALAALLLIAGGASAPSATAQASAELQGDIAPTHDPVIIREGGL